MPKHQYGRLDYAAVGIEQILTDFGVDIFSRRAGTKGPELRVACPHKSHDDTQASCDLNALTGNWTCLSHADRRPGNGEGSFETFITLWVMKHSPEGTLLRRSDVLKDLEERYPLLSEHRFVDPTLVQKYVDDLVSVPKEMLEALRTRGVIPEMLLAARAGYHARDERLTIPVFDEKGNCVNIRRYKPGHPRKMLNLDGFASKTDLYRVEDCKYDTIWLCGGELKAMVAGYYLNQRSIGAVSSCGGEGSWSNTWIKYLRGKTVYICMDVDAAGKYAAEKYAKNLFSFTKEVHIVSLPLDVTVYRKGDINDWVFVQRSAGRNVLEAFDELVKDHSHRWTPPTDAETIELSTYVEESLTSFASKAPVKNQRGACDVRFITGISADTFLLPSQVRFNCPRATEEVGADCNNCIVWRREEHIRATTDPTYVPNCNDPVEVIVNVSSADILDFIRRRKRDDASRKLALKLAGVYANCKHITKYEISKAITARQVEAIDSHTDVTLTRRHAVILQPPQTLDPAIAYRIEARCEIDPRDHRAVVIIDSLRPADDTIDMYEPLREDEALFRPFMADSLNADAIESRLNEIEDYFAINVTHIYGRRDLHLAADLTYHSVLELPTLFGKPIETGWINTLIVGDTGEGKSAVAKGLQRFYNIGDIVDCKAASFAGLLGGADISSGARIIVWGAIPRADRHLLILEELKGLDTRVLSQLTESRSSGVARLQRIAAATTNARTRLLMISNPRANVGGMRAQGSLWDVVSELMGSDEDVRRFDLVAFVVQGTRTEQANTTFSATYEAFKRLLLWTWSRKPENVKYEPELAAEIMRAVSDITAHHEKDEPVVNSSTLHEKLLRVSAAIAARTASMTDPYTLYITRAHVEVARRFIRRLYAATETRKGSGIKLEIMQELLVRCNLTSDLQWVRQSWARLRIIDDTVFMRQYAQRTIEPTTVFKMLGMAGAIETQPITPGSMRQVLRWTRDMLAVLSDPQHPLWCGLEGSLTLPGEVNPF